MDGQVVIDGGRSLAAIGIGEGGAYTCQGFITIDGATRFGIRVINAMYGVRAVRGMSNYSRSETLNSATRALPSWGKTASRDVATTC